MQHLKLLCTFLLILALTGQISCKYNLMKILNYYKAMHGDGDNQKVKDNKLFKFSYQNCGPNSDPFQVNSLQISPDPLKIPGSVTLSGDAKISQNITGPLTMNVKIIKLIGPVKFEIPCVENFGSCTYDDVCAMLPPSDQCPQYFKDNNIPCNCPFTSGEYTANNVELDVDFQAKIPSGQYIVLANFQNQALGHVGCVQMSIQMS